MKKRIVVLGGHGHIGSVIALRLRDKGHEIVTVDLESSSTSRTNEFTEVILHDQSLQYLEQGITEAIGILGGEIDVLVIATRFRSRRKGVPESNRDDLKLTADLDEHLLAGLISPVRAIELVVPQMKKGSRVIVVCSTNAISVSHQSLGYHASAAGLLQACRVISLRLAARRIEIYPICLGVLERYGAKQRFEGTDFGNSEDIWQVGIDDLCEFVSFIVDKGLRSSMGEPIVLSAGRSAMDVTAAVKNVYGHHDVF